MNKYCDKCGYKLLDNNKYCTNCGNQIVPNNNNKVIDPKKVEREKTIELILLLICIGLVSYYIYYKFFTHNSNIYMIVYYLFATMVIIASRIYTKHNKLIKYILNLLIFFSVGYIILILLLIVLIISLLMFLF